MLINPVDFIPDPIRKWMRRLAMIIMAPICAVALVRMLIAHQWSDAFVVSAVIAMVVWAARRTRQPDVE